MTERVSPVLPSTEKQRRRLSAGAVVLLVVFGLGFVGGNLAAPQVNVWKLFAAETRATPDAGPRPPPTVEDVRKGLAAAERKLRDRLDEKHGEAATTARTLYLMEKQKAAPAALGQLRQQAEKLRREVATLKERLAEVRTLRQGLRRADGPEAPPGQAREQEELDELTARARLWLEVGRGQD